MSAFNFSDPVYGRLRKVVAEKSRELVVVVGAGLSVPAGLPTWDGLLTHVRNTFIQRLHTGLVPAAGMALQDLIREEASIQDPWNRMAFYRQHLSDDEYVDAVAGVIQTSSAPPPNYGRIFDLRPSGVINLNLDLLARRAGGIPDHLVASGLMPEKYATFLLKNSTFLLHPHGIVTDPASWVLTSGDRNRLLSDLRYRRFLASLLQSRRLLFLGVRPYDVALQTILFDDVRLENADGVPSHYWLCPDPSADDRMWARSFNVEIIAYDSQPNHHKEIDEVLLDLRKAEPTSPPAVVAVAGPGLDPAELPDDDELRQFSPEEIRRRLNAAVAFLVSNHSDADDAVSKIAQFYSQYSLSVHTAWHVRDRPPHNVIWGHEIIAILNDSGAFGTVWRVKDPVSGDYLAAKVLREDIVRDTELLTAFRRGVRANAILSEANVPGMVRFRGAHETPACVFMDLVDGLTLENAVLARHEAVGSVEATLGIVLEVARIVKRGHDLDAQVLHRDLKPSNVMVRRDWAEDVWEVVVLDFDLSWYEGAYGRTVIRGTPLHNYAAPEQRPTRNGNYSSRHTGVDVYGLGMLLYFAVCCAHPTEGVQYRADFHTATIGVIASAWSNGLACLAEVTTNLIRESTAEAQEQRPSMPVLIARLESLMLATSRRRFDEGDPLCAAELLCSMHEPIPKDIWDISNVSVRLGAASMIVRIGLLAESDVRFVVSSAETGETLWKGVESATLRRAERAKSALLRHAKLVVVRERHSGGTNYFEVNYASPSLDLTDIRLAAEALRSGMRAMALHDG